MEYLEKLETIEEAMAFLRAVIKFMESKETPGLYLEFINRYLEKASIPELEDDASPLLHYVVNLMENPFIQIMVFTNPLMAIVFKETTMRYVVARLNQTCFQRKRSQFAAQEIMSAYQFAPNMRSQAWNTLVTKVSEQFEDYGFDKKFMENLLDNGGALEPQKWNKLIIDWATALKRKLVADVDEENSSPTRTFKPDEYVFKQIEVNMNNYLQSSTLSDMEANEQSLNLMHGIWSRSEYERVQPIIRKQKQYPSIKEVVNKMGRIADEDGKRHIPIKTGSSVSLTHSSGSDIEGITTSRQLSSLLPTELAFYSDEQLSDIFWHKYMQGNLQSFRYRSNIAKPTRSLSQIVRAKSKGPMIVCVDTSSSMSGEPMRIAQSVLSRVIWMANKQFRRCYLIYHTTHIKTIDLNLSNWSFDELRSETQGGTDATEMLIEVFHLLNTDENYMCADVLWISDFMVPDVEENLLHEMENFRKADTHFYGYKIGGYDTIWASRLDKIYSCLCSYDGKYI